jgi:phosphomannomutase
MMDALHKKGADFVGGTKADLYFPGFQVGADAMFALTKILELMARSGKRLGDVKGRWSNIKIVSKEVPCSWTKKGLVMRRLMEHTARKERILADGVRFFRDGAYILIKPDRMKASFYVQVEAGSNDKAKKLLKFYTELVKDWQGGSADN